MKKLILRNFELVFVNVDVQPHRHTMINIIINPDVYRC